jgi:surface protein
MSGMFMNAEAFNQPIGDWDTSKVSNMRFMFSRAKSFNQPVDGWNISNVEDSMLMFYEQGTAE